MTMNLFRGNPRLLISALPWAVGIVAMKLVVTLWWDGLELSPLLAGAIGAEVFILGFLLTGTASDFKEAERLPGELAASLETMADECLLTYQTTGKAEAKIALAQLIEIGRSVRSWLMQDRGLDDVMSDIRALNDQFAVMSEVITPGFVVRIKSEQHAVRRTVLRMDTMRRTSYVAAGYLIAEVTAVVLVVMMLVTNIGPLAPTLSLVGLISYLLYYLVTLIRDLDNPFQYPDGRPGAADVNLDVLARNVDRMRALLGALDATPAAVDPALVARNAGTADTTVVADQMAEPSI